jgi:DNA-binding NtrC family response regulator
MKQSILIVDDEPTIRIGLSLYLTQVGYVVRETASLSEARDAIVSQRFDAVILDQNLPDGNGIDWISDLRASHRDIAIIIITGAGDVPLAVEAMQRGADNFLTKPVNFHELEVFVQKCLELSALRRKDLTQQRLSKNSQPYFGDSPAMRSVMAHASTAAENDSVILLLGETGSGKGVLAQWVHEHSIRSSGPFVEINCSTLRGELLANELFGHAKGAFTSAVQDQQGLIEFADGGTLFLDEIGDMDLAVQAQFLKVIEEKKFRRLGEVKVRQSNFRLICATNKELLEEIRRTRFRQDLYYRIQVFPVMIPPLRERSEDLPGLIRHVLLAIHSPHPEVSPEVMSLLKAYRWPGNIRELRNVLERASLLARGRPIDRTHLTGLVSFRTEDPGTSVIRSLKQLEEDHIISVIERVGDNVAKAVDELGISKATLYRKLKKIRKSP